MAITAPQVAVHHIAHVATRNFDRKTGIMDTQNNAEMRELTVYEIESVSGGLIDKASPKLHEAACKGTHLPEVVIEVW